MWRLVLELPFNTLLVYRQQFISREEALSYKSTFLSDYPAFEAWEEGKIIRCHRFQIYIPFGELHKSELLKPATDN